MKITVLMHEQDTESVCYIILSMCSIWRDQGYDVEVLRGLGQPIRGDVVFLHIDFTVVPEEYLNAVADHSHVINRGAADISKTLFSRNQIYSTKECDVPVIVKTVLNHGGLPECRLEQGVLSRLRDRLVKLGLLPLGFTNVLDPHSYPIFSSACDVPRSVFRNPSLFVERFLPERCGEFHCLRVYSFFGDHYFNELYKSRQPIVKRSNSVEFEEVPAPDAIHTIRKQFGLDYGKLDYVLRNGEVVLLDVNRTPAVGGFPDHQRFLGQKLAEGITSFLPGAFPVEKRKRL